MVFLLFVKMPRISLAAKLRYHLMSDFLHRHALPFVHLCMFVCMYVMFCYITRITLSYIMLFHYVVLCYVMQLNVMYYSYVMHRNGM